MREKQRLITQVGNLRIFLTFHTLIILGFFTIIFFDPLFVFDNFLSFSMVIALFAIYRFLVIGYFIWFIQSKYPATKSEKNND